MLVLAYVQREIHDMPEAVLLLTIYLTFPAGLIGMMLAGWTTQLLPDAGVLTPIQQFWSVVPYWLIAVLFGYVQWFVAVPAVWLRFTKSRVI